MNHKLSSAEQDKKIRMIILVVTLVLTAVFIISAILTSVLSDNGGGNNRNNSHNVTGSLSMGTNTVRISSSGDSVYLSFTVYSSGRYTFTSNNSNSGIDPTAVLYDSDWEQLTSDDDSGGNRNFRLSYNLDSGSTYYLKVSTYSGSGSFTVTVSR